jgi:hypothetical protein
LSNLEEGLYTFVLRVTDNANQTSSPSEVHVFVKPPTNKPPVGMCTCNYVLLRFYFIVIFTFFFLAIAGKNLTLSLPQTWALLDGSKSNDDIGIQKWKWYQIRYKSICIGTIFILFY